MKNKSCVEKNSKSRKAVNVVLLLLFIVLVIGISYGYVANIINGSKLNKLTAGILDLELFEGEELIIENLYPQADPVGLIQEESFDFKLINKTENDTNYILKLQRVATPNELALTDVVYGLTKDNISSTGLLSELEGANYVVDSGTIKGNQTINYELRFWLREDVEDDTTTNNKTLRYKLSVDVSQYLTFNDFFENKVDTKTTIDFSQISSETNGRGIYKYQEDGEDIYYWRGKVEDNHVVFAGFCWEALRTTSTGGLKMIYDGVVGSDGSCKNTGESSSLPTRSFFNTKYNSPAYSGYMYGVPYGDYGTKDEQENSVYLYGNDVYWDGNKYTLVDTIKSTGVWSVDYANIALGHHYTCFNESGECETVSYIYYTNDITGSSYAKYIKLTNGEKIDDAWKKMHSNITASPIKIVIDTWYETNIDEKGYSEKIEDVVYCNDRSTTNWAGWTKDGDATKEHKYSSYTRNTLNGGYRPNLNCTRLEDRYTVNNKEGNNILKYPVGLITVDEIALAGGKWWTKNDDYYLYISDSYWSMTPSGFPTYTVFEFYVETTGNVLDSNFYASKAMGVRPVISLSSSVLPSLSGIGTETDPYIVN